MSSRRSKIIWICVVLVVAAVHAYGSGATREQRVLVHELEVIALVLFFAVVLVQNRIKFGVYFPGLKKKWPRVTGRSLAASGYEREERQSASTYCVPRRRE